MAQILIVEDDNDINQAVTKFEIRTVAFGYGREDTLCVRTASASDTSRIRYCSYTYIY